MPDRTNHNGDELGDAGSSSNADDGDKPDGAGNETSSKKLKKVKMKIGTWNIRTSKHGAVRAVASEADRCNIDVIGIAEHRMAGSGHFSTDNGGQVGFSGRKTTGYGGVAFYLSKKVRGALLGYDPISDRVMSIRLQAQPCNITIFQVYAPTSDAKDEDVEVFYEKLKGAVQKAKCMDMVLILGDFNAKVGKLQFDIENGKIGMYGHGGRNERGDRLAEFVVENDLCIMNTIFKQHPRRLFTWTHPNGSKHQIDYIIAPMRWKSSVKSVKTLPGTDCGSDHELVVSVVEVKLKKMKKEPMVVRYDLSEIDDQYKIDVKNRFSELMNIVEKKDPDELADDIKNIYIEAAGKHLPRKRHKKQVWISKETLDLIDRRREIRTKKGLRSEEYKAVSKEIKSS